MRSAYDIVVGQSMPSTRAARRSVATVSSVGSGKVRIVAIGEGGVIDLQPCGGTHVRATGEIGGIAVTKIEKKGKLNRRVRVAFV